MRWAVDGVTHSNATRGNIEVARAVALCEVGEGKIV
jgi:hypothetical protein